MGSRRDLTQYRQEAGAGQGWGKGRNWQDQALGPHGSMEGDGSWEDLKQGQGSYLVLSLRPCSQEQPSSSQCPARSKK